MGYVQMCLCLHILVLNLVNVLFSKAGILKQFLYFLFKNKCMTKMKIMSGNVQLKIRKVEYVFYPEK